MANPNTDPLALSRAATILWPAGLAVSAIIGSLVYACIFPFVAIAVVATATMKSRAAMITVAGAWAVNQLLGYAVMNYPHTLDSYSWGAAIGVASLAATVSARAVIGGEPRLVAIRLIAAFLAAFVTYEGLLFGFAQFAGGLETFSAEIVGLIARNDAIWLVGLIALRIALTGAAPRWFGPAQAVRFA